MSKYRSTALACLFLLVSCRRDDSTTPPAAPCEDFEIDVEHEWNSAVKVEIEAKIMELWEGELGVDMARQRASSVVTTMDAVTSDWVMLRRAVCLDHFERGIGTPEDYQAKVTCFDRVLQGQRTLVAAIDSGDAAAFDLLPGLEAQIDGCR